MFVRSLLLSAALAAGAFAAPAAARPDLSALFRPQMVMPAQYQGERREDIRSLREVVEEIRAQYGGRLIDARLEQGPRPIYVIRWEMPDGRVRDFRVPASR